MLEDLYQKSPEEQEFAGIMEEMKYLAFLAKHCERNWRANVYFLKMLTYAHSSASLVSYAAVRLKVDIHNKEAELKDQKDAAEREAKRVLASEEARVAAELAIQISLENNKRSVEETTEAKSHEFRLTPPVIARHLDTMESRFSITVEEDTHVCYTLDGTDPVLPEQDSAVIKPG